ncbi:uncharacterized protein LOC143021740 [Oratosquilla oratoria]|uniref:uncharacterized protein LOC143021740 n=1 Tax=Oratosquilla oratoria TaxID=337810 RepID=UPI003F770545
MRAFVLAALVALAATQSVQQLPAVLLARQGTLQGNQRFNSAGTLQTNNFNENRQSFTAQNQETQFQSGVSASVDEKNTQSQLAVSIGQEQENRFQAGASFGQQQGGRVQAGASFGQEQENRFQAGASFGQEQGSRIQAGVSVGQEQGNRFQAGASAGQEQGNRFQAGVSVGQEQGNRFQAGASAGQEQGNRFQAGVSVGQEQGNRFQAGASAGQVEANQFQAGVSVSSQAQNAQQQSRFSANREGNSQLQSGSSSFGNQNQNIQAQTSSSFNRQGQNQVQSGASFSNQQQRNRFQEQRTQAQSTSNQFKASQRQQTGEAASVVNGVFEPLNLPAGASLIMGPIDTSFACADRPYGYYADEGNACRIFHVCNPYLFDDGRVETVQYSFMCGEGSVFDQKELTCAEQFAATPCAESSFFYSRNEEFGRVEEKF